MSTESSSSSSSSSCQAKCSFQNGITLWEDGTITNHTYLSLVTRGADRLRDDDDDTTVDDPYWNQTCPFGYECTPTSISSTNSYNDNTPSYGCCNPCPIGRFCLPQSIYASDNALESNVCPDGYTCHNSTTTTTTTTTSSSSSSSNNLLSFSSYLTPCPSGTLCRRNNTLSCTSALTHNIFRELYVGMYCPAQSAMAVMCPRGSYCPDPSIVDVCPKGYYCPGKDNETWLVAEGCTEGGEQRLCRNMGQLVGVLLVVIGVVAVGGVLLWLKRRRMRRRVKGGDEGGKGMVEMTTTMTASPIALVLNDIEKRLFDVDDAAAANNDNGGTMNRQKSVLHNSFATKAAERLASNWDENNKANNNHISYDDVRDAVPLSMRQYNRFVTLRNRRVEKGDEKTEGGKDEQQQRRIVEFDDGVIWDLYAAVKVEPTVDDVSRLWKRLDPEETGVSDATADGDDGWYQRGLKYIMNEEEVKELVKEFVCLKEGKDDGHSPTKDIENGAAASSAGMGQIMISKDDFMEHYTSLLQKVTTSSSSTTTITIDRKGADIAFRDLSLSVVGADGTTKFVVDHLTGRVEGRKMTALMGGSGAGKTSLLNALCGRAFYGKVSGTIYINGREGEIDNRIRKCIGFVPQDDIVYPELTVLENLLFAGHFRLPSSTTTSQIRTLATEVIANMGLTRVTNSIVGDVTRRGLSGGEKKRVNIGLELMARPSLLFLDEPTSGLDASSSLLVTKALKRLCLGSDVTVCAVIHQPRKFIFEAFDNVVLLSVGGKMVYHGPTRVIGDYFEGLGYVLPEGDNVADWVIDISTGSLMPDCKERFEEQLRNNNNMKGDDDDYDDGMVESSMITMEDVTSIRQSIHVANNTNGSSPTTATPAPMPTTDSDIRDYLTSSWLHHFSNLSENQLKFFSPPSTPYDSLHDAVNAKPPSLWRQTYLQIKRRLIVMRRNKTSHFTDAVILIFAVILVTLINGTIIPVFVMNFQDISYYEIIQGMPPRQVAISTSSSSSATSTLFHFCSTLQNQDIVSLVDDLTAYAYTAVGGYNAFAVMLIGASTVIVAITASKPIRSQRLLFFRESGSGYAIAPYVLALSLLTALEVGLTMVLASLLALCLRQTMAPWISFVINAVLLSWISCAWGEFHASYLPPDAVVLVIGAQMIVMLFLSGGFMVEMFSLKNMAQKPALNAFAGLFSPGRFFVESYAVNEARCLPPQSGFACQTLRFLGVTNFSNLGLGVHDPNVAVQSCDGWFWNYLPMFLVGVVIRFMTAIAMHMANRPKMPRRALRTEFRTKPGGRRIMVVYFMVFLAFGGFLVLAVWSFSTSRGAGGTTLSDEEALCELILGGGAGSDTNAEQDCLEVIDLVKEYLSSDDGDFKAGLGPMQNVCENFISPI